MILDARLRGHAARARRRLGRRARRGCRFAEPYQALILASIVEKEAALKSERALIAGVFVNRLRKGMRLQSDPTVIYGLGERYDGSIHTRDLQTDTPYNTYTREGLPPTPIALPGRESLRAAVHPEETEALYFVATGAGDGAHHFSSTLEEHNRAVQAYLARLRARTARARRAQAAASDERGQVHHPRGHRGGRQIHGRARSWSRPARGAGVPVLATREPGGTPLAERMRQIVLERGTESVTPVTETLLMFAARALHVSNLIRPALARGEWVICDRFTDATRAYQGSGRGVDAHAHRAAGAGGARGSVARLHAAAGPAGGGRDWRARARAPARRDRFEAETVAFFERVRAGYLAHRAARDPQRVRVIDARSAPGAGRAAARRRPRRSCCRSGPHERRRRTAVAAGAAPGRSRSARSCRRRSRPDACRTRS